MRAAHPAITSNRMTTSNFHIVPLPSDLADDAREAVRGGARDDALVEVDSPRSFPCRHCLSWAEPGERVILFSYTSIPAGHPSAGSAPIVVYEQRRVVICAPAYCL